MKKTIATIFLLLTFIFLLGAEDPNKKEVPSLKAKWTNKDIWQTKIREGLPERAVLKFLGKPKYELRGSELAYYYQGNIKVIPLEEESKIPTIRRELEIDATWGIIRFRHVNKGPGKSRRPNFVVASVEQPDLSNCENEKENVENKIRPKQKLEKWQDKKNWNKLIYEMNIDAVANILGRPHYEDQNPGGRISFYYDDIKGCGVLHFHKNRLKSWRELYWPDVEKRFYEEIQGDAIQSHGKLPEKAKAEKGKK